MAPSAITPPSESTGHVITSFDLTKAAIKANSGYTPVPRRLDASLLEVTKTSAPRVVPMPGSPAVWDMNICCDHMVTVPWTKAKGWGIPQLKAYGDFTISPAASCLHYATQCFEGMKVYRGYDNKLRLFRPDLNAARLNMSAQRIALPGFEPEELVKLVEKMVATDGAKWLPKTRPGTFLYLRPAMIGNGRQLGVQVPKEALLYIIMVPWPDFSSESPPGAPPKAPGLRLLASRSDTTRAWPGGFGYAKVGANYGPSMVAHGEAQGRGYDQILWLLQNPSIDDLQVTEAGASNFFLVVRTEEGKIQLITAPLEDKVILAGVTRGSVLELARERLEGEVEIVERAFGMNELVRTFEDGRVVEAFVTGTAFFVMPVSVINFMEKELVLPMSDGKSGKYAAMIKGWLSDIMYGNVDHKWGIVVEEE